MIGQRLGHYDVIEKLGEGGMGVVYKAHDAVLNRTVAIKVLPAGKAGDQAKWQRFLNWTCSGVPMCLLNWELSQLLASSALHNWVNQGDKAVIVTSIGCLKSPVVVCPFIHQGHVGSPELSPLGLAPDPSAFLCANA